MKKQNWLVLPLALLLVFGLAFLGCDNSTTTTPGGSNPNDPVDPTGPRGDLDDGTSWYHVLASEKFPKEITMVDNFQYGKGYQGQILDAELFEGNKVLREGTYWLKATFTTARDLENPLYTGLVDGAEEVGWWGPLTWDGDDEDDEGTLVWTTDENGDYTASDDYIIEKDVVITTLIKLTALQGATSDAPGSNVLNFQTEGSGDPGTAGSGVLKAFKITFTELLLVKDTTYDEDEAAAALADFEPPPSVYLAVTVGSETQYPEVFGASASTVTGAGTEVDGKDDTWTGYQVTGRNYQANYAWFAVDIGSKSLSFYDKLTFTALGVSGDVTSKKLELWAQNTAFTGAGVWSGAPEVQSATGDFTSGTENLTITINGAKANDLTGTVYLAIYWAGANGAVDNVYQLSNIALVARTECNCGGLEAACFYCQGDCNCDGCVSMREATATSAFDVTFASDADITVEGPFGDDQDGEPSIEVSSVLGFDGDEHGYTFTQGGTTGYPNTYAVFQITLPAGIYLADYESVSLTYGAISGDAGWKPVVIGISANDLTGYGAVGEAEVTNNVQAGANNGEWISITIPISRTEAIELDSTSTLYVGINVSTQSTAVYSISNIVFNPITADD